MPTPLPPIPRDEWDAHQDDLFEKQTGADLASLSETVARRQQLDDTADAEFAGRVTADLAPLDQHIATQAQADRMAEDDFTQRAMAQVQAIMQPPPAATNGRSFAQGAGPVAPKALGGVTSTTVDLGLGKSGGGDYDHQGGLARVYRDALDAGLDEEGARAAVAVAQTEGGMGGAQGDASIGGSRGTFQLYFGGGQGDNFAQQHQMSKADADALLAADPHAANQWALRGYLGNAIREGRAKGLSGPALATYAQQHGQVSVSPERAGQNYQALFADGKLPFDGSPPAGPDRSGTPSLGAPSQPAGEPPDDETFADAAEGAVDQATGSTPDVPPLYFGGGPVPYVPSKPTQPPQDATDKMLGGQPLDGQDFLSSMTKASGNQGTAQLMSEDGPSPQVSVPSVSPPPKSKVHALLDQLGDVLTGMVKGAPSAEDVGQAAENLGQGAASVVGAVPSFSIDPLAGLGGSSVRVRLPSGREAVDWLRAQGQEQIGGPAQVAERAAFEKLARGETLTPEEERAITEGPSAQFAAGMAGGGETWGGTEGGEFTARMVAGQEAAARARARGETPRPKRPGVGGPTSMAAYEKYLAEQEAKAAATGGGTAAEAERYYRGRPLTPEEFGAQYDALSRAMPNADADEIARAISELEGAHVQDVGVAPPSPEIAAERAAMPAAEKIMRQWDSPPARDAGALAQRLEDARTFLVRKLTDRRVDLNQVQKDVQRLYGPLPEDMQVSELSRLNPSGAATLRVQNEVAPVIREAGDDLGYVNTVLAAKGNVDVAAAFERRQRGVPRLQGELGLAEPAAPRGPQTEIELPGVAVTPPPQRMFSGGVTAADSARALDEIAETLGPERYAKVEAMADKIAQVNRDLRQQLVDAGRITQETADEWARAYPNYTPVQVVDYLAEQAGLPLSGQGKSLGVRGGGIQALSAEGTARARLSPVASTINNVYTVESLAKQNATVNALRNWVERVPEMANRFQVVDGTYSGTRAERAVSGWRNGEKFSVVTPFEEMAKVLRQEPTQTIPIIGPIMQVFKELITARSPTFLVRNTMMDFPTYLIRETAMAGGTPAATAKAIGRYVAAIPDAFSGLLSGEFRGAGTQRYLAQGGSMESWAQKVRSPKDAERYVQELRRTGGIHLGSVSDIAHVSKAILSGQAFKTIGERVELVPRLAAFRAGEEAGLNPARAVIRGREVTVDFAEGGTWVKWLSQLIPFLNPGVQGGANLARTIYRNPKGAGMTLALGVSVPTLAIEAWNESDPERSKAYADVPNYVKDRGLVMMLPGAGGKGVLTYQDEQGNPKPQYFAIPLREFAPVADATRAAARTAFGAETRSWGDLLLGGLMQAIPAVSAGDLTPLGARTYLELKYDKDFYRGSAIATKNADERATILSKALADGYNEVAARFDRYPNVRPSQVEFATRENLGAVGQLAQGASDLVTGKKADSTNPQDIPVVGGFLRGSLGNATGQQLESAREARLDPDVKRTLYDTGLVADVSAARNEIGGVKLLQGEQTRYQELANERVNANLRRLLDNPKFERFTAEQKKNAVSSAISGAKDSAAAVLIKEIGKDEFKDRLRAAAAKKAG